MGEAMVLVFDEVVEDGTVGDAKVATEEVDQHL